MIIPGKFDKDIESNQKNISAVQEVAELIQIDVADGTIVNGNNGITPEKIATLKSTTALELDLMVLDPILYIPMIPKAFTHIISDIDANNIEDFIYESQQKNLKVGLSVKLETPLANLGKYIDSINYIQLRSADPGDIGRPFEPKVLEKIKECYRKWPELITQTDGHMNEETIPLVKSAGVSHFVVGSAIFNGDDPIENLKKLSNLI